MVRPFLLYIHIDSNSLTANWYRLITGSKRLNCYRNIVILSTEELYVRYNMLDIDRIPAAEIPDRLHRDKTLQ